MAPHRGDAAAAHGVLGKTLAVWLGAVAAGHVWGVGGAETEGVGGGLRVGGGSGARPAKGGGASCGNGAPSFGNGPANPLYKNGASAQPLAYAVVGNSCKYSLTKSS